MDAAKSGPGPRVVKKHEGPQGNTLEDAWPQDGVYVAHAEYPLGKTIRMEFNLRGETAEERLSELEDYMRLLPIEARYLEEVADGSGGKRVRENFNKAVGWKDDVDHYAAPRRVPEDLEGLLGCLREAGATVDGVAVLSDAVILPCFYIVPPRAIKPGAKTSNLGHKCAAQIARLAIGAEVCSDVVYEKANDSTLNIELWKGSELWRVVALSLKVYKSPREIAYGPWSSGLLFCSDGRRLATPTMQFLMLYGLAVDAPSTNKGVRAALSPGFEACDVLLPYCEAWQSDGLPSDDDLVRMYRDAAGGISFFLNRGSVSNRGKNPGPSPPGPAPDNVRLMAEGRCGEIRRRGTLEQAMCADTFSAALSAQANVRMIGWMNSVKKNVPPADLDCPLAGLGADAELAALYAADRHKFNTACCQIFEGLDAHAEKAAKAVFCSPREQREAPLQDKETPPAPAEMPGVSDADPPSVSDADPPSVSGADSSDESAQRATSRKEEAAEPVLAFHARADRDAAGVEDETAGESAASQAPRPEPTPHEDKILRAVSELNEAMKVLQNNFPIRFAEE